MTNSDLSDDRVLFDAEPAKRIATITLNNPAQRNSYDAAMRDKMLPRKPIEAPLPKEPEKKEE